ncbi:alpha,alpha-trehalase TreF [Dyella flava]|uniref:Alpha,alpha-trehalase TreF n=1 Tax=Dyella flava TaxID=1920170 RepID=A0ABS2K1Y4_9GAMM|nr:alpha,alpha-trehalase TreF [Dyella flava]MBM7125060.1 alpha,alpha-trehalase TreF [Dyella flava]GLQ51933.1 cytoplasmic trehalase [Dyella flava]
MKRFDDSSAITSSADFQTPADQYQELFEAVQLQRVFADSKTFVDCVPQDDPEQILADYRSQQSRPGFDLSTFAHTHFDVPSVHESHYVSVPGQPLRDHIDGLWEFLTRQPDQVSTLCSLLPLPREYVVPGGRFAELYYWDSYFTMLGLAESGRHDLLHAMADNFAYLIDSYGHIPNGNRTYYLSRSQPPVFALMVELFEQHEICKAIRYLPQLRKEYDWWMQGAATLQPGEAYRHVVRLADGTLLNRYWDARDTPREEAFLEDVLTAQEAARSPAEVYRDLRAAAASGWDFSSRWCDGGPLASIRTTAIVPVDLNSFLWKLEQQIALLSRKSGLLEQAQQFERHEQARREAIDRVLWHAGQGVYLDYDWQRRMPRERLNAAVSTPLYVGVASKQQARLVAENLRTQLLSAGGIEATTVQTAQQWDRPNGWAPLQWLAIGGLRRYGQCDLSEDIAHRWLCTVGCLYQRESKLVEKYVLDAPPGGTVGGGGGEYPLQDGFGWTNGVTRRLLHERPRHAVNHARAAST